MKQKMKRALEYRWPYILAGILAIVVGLFFVQNVIASQKQNNQLFILVQNQALSEQELASLRAEIEEHTGLSQDEFTVDASFASTGMEDSQASVTAYLRSGRVDLIIAPEETFNVYASTGYLSEVDDPDGTGFYAQTIDISNPRAVRSIPFHPHQTQNAVCRGMYVNDNACAGVLVNGPHKKLAMKILKMMEK